VSEAQETVQSPEIPPRSSYPPDPGARLGETRLALLLKLHSEGTKQHDIARILGCTQPAISQALARLGTDTVELARHHLKSRAYKVSRKLTKVAEKGKDADSVKAARLVLAGSGVITETSTVQLGIQVIIGGESQPAIGAGSVQVEALETTPAPQQQPE
jgi:hypothetical protein